MRIDETLNRRLELGDAAKGTAPNLFHREFGKPAFDEADPRALSRGEVDVKARTLGKSVSNQCRFVRAVVVHDDVHVEWLGNPLINHVENLTELCGSVPLMKLGDHVARLRVERGKQGGRAVTRVVMRPAFHLPGLQRQQRLRALERLDLRFLIDAKHGRVGRRIEIQADDIADLLDPQWIVRELEGLAPVRLQAERVPMRLIAV